MFGDFGLQNTAVKIRISLLHCLVKAHVHSWSIFSRGLPSWLLFSGPESLTINIWRYENSPSFPLAWWMTLLGYISEQPIPFKEFMFSRLSFLLFFVFPYLNHIPLVADMNGHQTHVLITSPSRPNQAS